MCREREGWKQAGNQSIVVSHEELPSLLVDFKYFLFVMCLSGAMFGLICVWSLVLPACVDERDVSQAGHAAG